MNKRFQYLLEKYKFYFLPPAGIGKELQEKVEYLLKGIGNIRKDQNYTLQITPLNYYRALRRSSIPQKGWGIKKVIDKIILPHLGLIPNVSGGYAPSNVIPPPIIPAILAKIASTIINPNIIIDTYGGKANEAEKEAISQIAKIIGYNPNKSAGFFTSGGALSNYWSMRYALEKFLPHLGEKGFFSFKKEKLVLFQSEIAHYTNINAARLLGVGTDNIINIPVREDFSLDVEIFKEKLKEAIEEKKKVFYIYLLAGSTDAFGVDDIWGVYSVCKEVCNKFGVKPPHIHIDAAVGWIYGIFLKYSLSKNPLGFDNQTLFSIKKIKQVYKNLKYADSVTVDPHKHGFTPYACSALILKNRNDLALLQKSEEETPYFNESIYHSFPGHYTPESSRSADAPLMSLATLYALGMEGYQVLIGYAIQQTNRLKKELEEESKERIKVLNISIPGVSTVWRIYPSHLKAKETFLKEFFGSSWESKNLGKKINRYNQKIFNYRKKHLTTKEHILGYSTKVIVGKSGIPISGWKCILFHPFSDIEKIKREILNCLKVEEYSK